MSDEITVYDEEYLKALRHADRALERLWKASAIKSTVFYETSKMQCSYIHPEIRRMESLKVKVQS